MSSSRGLFVFVGGFNLFTGPHVPIRPDVAVRLVAGDSHPYAPTAVAAHVTCHLGVHDAQ
jgi:hypothetical protein